jgi:hypothetical protein
MSKPNTHVGTITKLDLIRGTRSGHAGHVTGTGVHRDWKKQPKGGRKRTTSRAIGEW